MHAFLSPAPAHVAARWLRARDSRAAARQVSSIPFYHGTSLADAEAIKRSGFRLSRAVGRGAFMGRAVYITGNWDNAHGYMWDVWVGNEGVPEGKPRDAAVIEMRLDAQNPIYADPKLWPESFIEYAKSKREDAVALHQQQNWRDLGWLFERAGHDAVIYPKGTTIVYDPKVIRVVKLHVFKKEDATNWKWWLETGQYE